MSYTLGVFSVTHRAFRHAVNLYFEPLLLFKPLRRKSTEKKRRIRTRHRIDALVGTGVMFIGNIVCEDKGVRIDGHIVGDIECKAGAVVVSAGGEVEGTIYSEFVVINGVVKGNIVATGVIELQSLGKIDGDIIAPIVEMQSGASVLGKVATSAMPESTSPDELRETVRAIAEEEPRFHIVK